MRCLITGGAGFIGSHLVDHLFAENHKVIVIDDLSLGNIAYLIPHRDSPNFLFYQRSINSDLSDIFNKEKIEIVFHLAALPRVQFSIQHPKKAHEANVEGTFNLLETCRKHNVKRFVFSSSSSVYGDQPSLPLIETMTPAPLSPYALHKLIGEYYCSLFRHIYGLETISLRYFNVYGPRQSAEGGYACLIPKIVALAKDKKPPIINGDGEQTRDFTYVEDVIDANIKAAMTTNTACFGQAFNIGSGKNTSVNKVVETILSLLNNSIKPIHNPPVIEPKNTLAEITKSRQLLNWQPTTSFIEGIAKTLNQ